MTLGIRHRRLYAFFNSKVLSVLMWIVITNLLIADGGVNNTGWILPICAAGIAMLLFIGYSLWFWIQKPKVVTINTRLSDQVSVMTLYFMGVAAFGATSVWWFTPAVMAAVVILFIAMVRGGDESFEI